MLSLEELKDKIAVGAPEQSGRDTELLYDVVSRGGTYVEIGTKWGGSAIVAGLAGCEVHCIDHWEYPDRARSHWPTQDIVRENWEGAGLDIDKLHIHVQRHPPWPAAIEGRKFHIGMIDGSHYEDAVRLDWESMRTRITKFLIFHDVDHRHAHYEVRKVFMEAAQDPDWEVWYLHAGDTNYGILSPCERS